MIRYRLFLSFIALLLLALAGLGAWSLRESHRHDRLAVPAQRAVVARLELTDLAIWTEARYTRHPSQADFFTPFQDFPSAPDHFPAGSVVPPKVPIPAEDKPDR
jgi:DMSO/TMAO reductase YedYZ molybdopterin-dependent catalytic subunit